MTGHWIAQILQFAVPTVAGRAAPIRQARTYGQKFCPYVRRLRTPAGRVFDLALLRG